MTNPVLSAVIACYRDAPAILPMHARLTDAFRSLGVSYEIIFVNDGSPDDANSILSELTARDDHVLAIEHSRNFGSQNAFVSGMQLAAGNAVVLLDGDLQDPPEVIPAFYEKWREGNDVVYGRRTRREGSRSFALLAKLFYRVFRATSHVPVPLDAGDFALLDRKVVNELLAFPETDQFLRGLRAWVGFKQVGVDYTRPARPYGRSNNGWLRNVWWAKKAIFSLSFLPMELIGCVAVPCTVLSFCALIWQSAEVLLEPQRSRGIWILFCLIAFLGSLNLLAIAIVGQYVMTIAEETKRRPRFIRNSIRHRGRHFVAASEIEELVQTRRRDTIVKSSASVAETSNA